MNELTIHKDQGHWTVEGVLSGMALSALSRRWWLDWPREGAWVINCQKARKMDSAGLAFLVECVRHAQLHGVTLTIKHLPKAMAPLMKIQGVFEVLESVSG